MKDVDVIIDKLKKGEEVVLRFNGEKTDDEGIELLRESLLNRIQKPIKNAICIDICTNNVHTNTFYLLPTPTKLYIISI